MIPCTMYLNDDRDDVAFLTGSGSSKSRVIVSIFSKSTICSPLNLHHKFMSRLLFVLGSSGREYSKRDLYERGHVAVCSHRQVGNMILYHVHF